LAAHDKNKPENVTLPSAPIDKHLTENLNNLNNQFETTENEIIQANSEVSTNAIKINSAEKILDKLSNFEIQFEQFKKHISSDLSTFEIPFDSIVKLDIQKKPLREKVELLKAKRKEAENLIDSDEAESLTLKRTHIQNQIDNLQSELDEPSKQYEEYQTNLRSWEYQRTEIVGDVKRVGAILYFEKQIDELKKLPSLSKTVRIERLNIVEEIFLKIESLASVYRELYSPVQAFSSENRISNDGFDLKFDVSIIDQGLEQHFFDWIARNVTGSFYGSEEGLKTLKKIIDQHNFNNWIGVKSFLNELLDHLEFDKRQNAKAPMHVKTQLRKEKESSSFYDYLFSLDYLRPRYVLKLDDKELSQLSPGERGSLLLIFYLLVDKARIPLIIDQPEENLDNQTVYRHVVNAIKQAKNRRQVIIVTHNPNLAVVCDAEQIICCSIDKKNGNRMTYKSGSIENPYINQQIVDILEGTKPAFTNRRKKYAPFQEPSTILENNNNAS
jgi:DNA repair exonuclease SbcCD ATPase subunit